mgnify:FL=1
MLSSIPIVGGVFAVIGKGIDWALCQPPDLVIGTLRTVTGWVFGGGIGTGVCP